MKPIARFLSTLSIFCLGTAQANGFMPERGFISSDLEAVLAVQQSALDLTKTLKIPPPLAAWLWSIANHSAAALYKSNYKTDRKRALDLYSEAFAQTLAMYRQQINDQNNDYPTAHFVFAAWKSKNNVLQSCLDPKIDLYGSWEKTPPGLQDPLLPSWGSMELWSRSNHDELSEGLSFPNLSTPAFVKQRDEVQQLGQWRKNDTLIPQFWAAGPGTVTPPGMWMQIAMQLALARNLSALNSVTLFEILSKALSDAGVMAWDVKYKTQILRPITAIRKINKTWEPLLPTPPFPTFVSGHSTFSAAGATVLHKILPLQEHEQIVVSSEPFGTRPFKSYEAAAKEAGWSRILGGIHFRSDDDEGQKLGMRSACAVLAQYYSHACDDDR